MTNTPIHVLRAGLTQLLPQTMVAAAIYPLRKAAAEARWTPTGEPRRGLARWAGFVRALRGPRRRWTGPWSTLGHVTAVRPLDRGAQVETEHALIEIIFFAADLVRVRYLPRSGVPDPTPPSYAIAKPLDQWPDVAFVQVATDGGTILRSAALGIGIRTETGQVILTTPGGELLRVDIDAGRAPDGALRHRVALAPGERLYGLGERATPWNRRGRTHRLWNSDPAGYVAGDDPLDLNVPVTIGVLPGASATPNCYLAFYDNPGYAEFDLGNSTPEVAEHRFAGGELCVYLAVGAPPDLIERYTDLTGRHPLQPLWMLGYHQSRWSYDSETRVRKLAQDFAEHRVPCDAIHLDIDYMDGFRCFTWDHSRFSNPQALSQELQQQGIKLISIIDPGVKRDPAYSVYREGCEQHHFCTLPDGRIFHAPVWPGDSAFPDFSDPGTRTWWSEQVNTLVEDGIAGVWTDMNEPSAFGAFGERTLPGTVRHAAEGSESDHRHIHNVYGLLMARATREGLERRRPDARPVVITRAGWAGVQRYATSWTGDNESSWESLGLTVPMMLGLGLSGIGFSGPDVGGFTGQPDGELYTRWIQMATFLPFFRSHTAKGFPDQEPWSYGEPFLSIVRRFIELRYELLPYLYTAMWQMSSRGWPMVRPLAWLDAKDASLWHVHDAFLCGDALLVAPVLQAGATARRARLPQGTWYDFWTNQLQIGGEEVDAFAPLETMPLWARAGSVLAMGENGPSVEQRVRKFLRLSAYALPAPGEVTSELYEDAGEGMTYETGAFRVSRLTLHQNATRLTITWSHTGAYDPPYEHVELTLNGLRRVPRAIEVDGQAYQIAHADPMRRAVVLGLPRFTTLVCRL